MAEIKIEKKSPIWPWILLVVAIIAIVVYFVYDKDKDNNDMYDDGMNNEAIDTISNNNDYGEDYPTTAPYIDSTRAVTEFENSIVDSTRIGVDSIYTKKATINLAKVVMLKAVQHDLQPSIALENLKYYSNQVNGMTTTGAETPENPNVYKNFKTVSKDIVAVLETIQTKGYPSLEEDVASLKQTSNKIEVNIKTEEQKNNIQAFFSKAKGVVNNMNT